VYLAGFLADKFVAPDANVNASNTDVSRALPYASALSVSLEDLMLRVRQRLANMWPEIDRLAEALAQCGELDAGGILRAIRTPVAWLQA
jgi:hypothetical protein